MQAPSSFPTHVRQVAGTRVHHIEAGDGDVVLLIHGSLCDYRYWRWQVPAFSPHFRVVAPSLPGCWPEAMQAEFSMEKHVQAVVELSAQLAQDRPLHLVGHSRGAQVALESALAMPGRVGRLVLADPGFPFAGEPVQTSIHAQVAARLGAAPLDDVIGEFVDAVNGPGTWRQTVSWFKDMVRANAWTLRPQLGDLRRAIDLGMLARTLDCPVLLVGGELSPPRYGSRIEALAKALPQARQAVVPRAAHGMNLANARYFNDIVLRFLRGEA